MRGGRGAIARRGGEEQVESQARQGVRPADRGLAGAPGCCELGAGRAEPRSGPPSAGAPISLAAARCLSRCRQSRPSARLGPIVGHSGSDTRGHRQCRGDSDGCGIAGCEGSKASQPGRRRPASSPRGSAAGLGICTAVGADEMSEGRAGWAALCSDGMAPLPKVTAALRSPPPRPAAGGGTESGRAGAPREPAAAQAGRPMGSGGTASSVETSRRGRVGVSGTAIAAGSGSKAPTSVGGRTAAGAAASAAPVLSR